MGSSSYHGVQRAAMAKQLKVLLPSSFHKLRISDDFAGHFDAGTPRTTALVVSSFGKVWPVEVGRDGDGAFLGRGWPEFVSAHAFGVGWFLVLRHEALGALTVKAFDTSCCLTELSLPRSAATRSNRYASRKPQFLKVLLPSFMEKMLIPAEFVQHYIAEVHRSSQMAVVVSPLGKFWHIELEKDGSGIFLAGGWSRFLTFHDISEGEVVLLRYEGNMAFKIKVFGLNGCQKDIMAQGTRIQHNTEKQQEAPASCRKRKRKIERSSGKEKSRPISSLTSTKKEPSKMKTHYEIGPPSWIKKEINISVLQHCYLSLPVIFCTSIGFSEHCTITLKTSIGSTMSWQVDGRVYKSGKTYLIGVGWKIFCQENGLKEGDLCTFNVIETTLWHVVITRCSARTR